MNWQLFASIYTLIFIAELPDKTAFATLLLAARGRAGAVLLGVAIAFFIQTAVAVAFGSALNLLPEKWIHFGSGVLFVAFAVHSWRECRSDAPGACASVDASVAESQSVDPSVRATFSREAFAAFIVIFIAEWGDLTQIATASLTAKYGGNKGTVFFAALAALWTVTGLAVVIGQRLEHWVDPRRLQRVSGVLFLAIGLYFIVEALTNPQ